jgi:adenylate kinase family enzyme
MASLKMDAILLIGPTASGKTPLGEMVAERGIEGLKCHHFDFGAQLREIASGPGQEGFSGEEVAFIRGVLKEGLLLEDEHFSLARKIFRSFLRKREVAESDIVIINGLPRHSGQAVRMHDIVNVRAVVLLECSVDDVIFRISENTGGDRTGREDDEGDLINKKIEIYHNRTAPLIHYYTGQGAVLIRIPVTASSAVPDIYKAFQSRFQEEFLSAR